MPAEQIEALLLPILLVASSGLLGLVGLFEKRREHGRWLTGFFLPIVIVGVSGCLARVLASWTVFAAGALPPLVALGLTCFRTWQPMALRLLTSFLRRPHFHALGFLLTGPVIAILWGFHFDRSHATPDVVLELPVVDDLEFVGKIFDPKTARQYLTTDLGSPIAVVTPTVDEDMQPLLRQREAQLTSVSTTWLLRTGPVDSRYNCFGWVFTAGRGWLNEPDTSRIMADNGYQQTSEPEVGDVIVYRKMDKLCHVGVVRQLVDRRVIVESKWGTYGRFLHFAEDQPFSAEFTYFRSNRADHVVRPFSSPTN